jgi:hypothetical protein
VTLCVNGEESVQDHWKRNSLAKIFLNILLIFTNIRHLKFYSSACTGTSYISFANQFPTFSSSTLIELHMNVYRLDDCLFLIDGRLNQLRILFLTTFYIFPLESTNINKVNYFLRNRGIPKSKIESGGTVPNPIPLRSGSKSRPLPRRDGIGTGITVKKRDRDYGIPRKYFTRVKVRRSSIR